MSGARTMKAFPRARHVDARLGCSSQIYHDLCFSVPSPRKDRIPALLYILPQVEPGPTQPDHVEKFLATVLSARDQGFANADLKGAHWRRLKILAELDPTRAVPEYRSVQNVCFSVESLLSHDFISCTSLQS